jgi:hypothetical protein
MLPASLKPSMGICSYRLQCSRLALEKKGISSLPISQRTVARHHLREGLLFETELFQGPEIRNNHSSRAWWSGAPPCPGEELVPSPKWQQSAETVAGGVFSPCLAATWGYCQVELRALSSGSMKSKPAYSRGTCTPMFIAALFTIAKLWRQPRCPSTDAWIWRYI